MPDSYGTALSVVAGLPTRWSYATGPLAVAQDVARRLQTPRGSLDWAPEVGVDVAELLGAAIDTNVIAEWEAKIGAEALANDRVANADVTIVEDGDALRITVDLTLTGGESPSFALVLAAGTVTVEILRAA